MKRLTPILILFGLSVSTAWAGDVQVNSSTTFRGFTTPGNPDQANHYPFYEYVTLNTRDVGVEGLAIDASLWGKLETAEETSDDDHLTGDVNVLLVTYRAPQKTLLEGLEVRGGRQFVALGPSTLEQMDGGLASYRLPYGFSVTGFGGALSGVRFVRQPWPLHDDDIRYGPNWIAGGRLGYTFRDLISLGAGYRQSRYAGRMAFNEASWDATVRPLSRLTLLTDGVFELTSERLKEIRASARWEILAELYGEVIYRYTSPDLFVPRSSIFAVFSDELNQEFLGELDWSPLRWLTLRGDGGAILYGSACVNNALTGEGQACDDSSAKPKGSLAADIRFGAQGRHRTSFEFERIGAPESGLWRWRLAGSLRLLQRLSTIIDLDTFLLDNRSGDEYPPAQNRTDFGFAGSAYLMFAPRDDLSLLVGGQGLTSPTYANAGSFMVRVNWTFDGQTGSPSTDAVQVTRSSNTGRYGGSL